MFFDNAQQFFAFTPQANFPAHNSNFQGEGDGIKSRLPFKFFSTLLDKMANNFVQECTNSRIYAVEKTLQIFRDKSFANEQKKNLAVCLYLMNQSHLRIF